MRRPKQHGEDWHLAMASYKNNWIKSLRAAGLDFEIVVLQRCADQEELNSAERWWVAVGREALGGRFTNICDGGEGGRRSVPVSAEEAPLSGPKAAEAGGGERKEAGRYKARFHGDLRSRGCCSSLTNWSS
jgi:hypothetical protein